MSLKRTRTVLSTLTISAALCGMLLSFMLESDVWTRARASQILIFVSLVGFAVTAATRGRAEAVDAARASAHSGDACTFSCVAANETALESLKELRDFLRAPEKYARYGARMPRGVLLYGPPGTGKTLLARALAGEANVPFFALSGSDFVEKYVGVGASRVRELFRKARKAKKCVIFIDEIDALGKRRDENASDERDQTLNALLSEMSGFRTGDGAIIIAATNRIEALDPALLRPGRFDRQIEVGLPDREQRLSILRLHSAGKPIEDGVSLEELAGETVSFSGAALENLLNEAALTAAARDRGVIGRQDIRAAFYKTVAGADRPMLATEAERRIIAVHEAGHAVVSRVLAPENRLARVSILPAGHGAAGYNLCIPTERVMPGKRHLLNQICVLLAGRAAEHVTFGEDALTSGASSDLARAAEIAAAMITELGMGGDPSVSVATLNRLCGQSAGTAEACRALLDGQYEHVKALLIAENAALNALADALTERESLEGSEAEAIIDDYLSTERRESA